MTFELATGPPVTQRRYCTQFGIATHALVLKDGSDGRRYKAVAADAPPACPP